MKYLQNQVTASTRVHVSTSEFQKMDFLVKQNFNISKCDQHDKVI